MQAFSNNERHVNVHFRDKKSHDDNTVALSDTRYLNQNNTRLDFRDGFLYATFDGEEKAVRPCRAFPLEAKWSYICLIAEDETEVGIVRELTDFSEGQAAMLKKALDLRYYTPVIKSVTEVKERYGFSYWKVETDEGEVSFAVRDTYHSIFPLGGKGLVVMDADGNRFEIPDVHALDKKSFKKIELFL